jgi:hypothetical protein
MRIKFANWEQTLGLGRMHFATTLLSATVSLSAGPILGDVRVLSGKKPLRSLIRCCTWRTSSSQVFTSSAPTG